LPPPELFEPPKFLGWLRHWLTQVETLEHVLLSILINFFESGEVILHTLLCQMHPVLTFALRLERVGVGYKT